MNSVERGTSVINNAMLVLILHAVVHYSSGEAVKREAPHEIPEKKPVATWPERGDIEFNNVFMKYREGLPNVLRGISLSVRGGEKIGIVGRYILFLCSKTVSF